MCYPRRRGTNRYRRNREKGRRGPRREHDAEAAIRRRERGGPGPLGHLPRREEGGDEERGEEMTKLILSALTAGLAFGAFWVLLRLVHFAWYTPIW